MSITIRIEVPSHTYSFHVTVPSISTVRDLKQAIHEQCQGKPTVEGQRLITKGRVLQDDETIAALWATGDTKIVFLAVNPNSWTSIPPNLASRASTSTASQSSSFASSGLRFASQGPHPLSFIHFVHANALRALQRAPLVMNLGSWDIHNAREWSKMIVESYGYEWPPVLDEEFPGDLPTIYPTGEGVFYRSQYINGYPYMSLSPKSTEPTPLQARALEILTYTFPLLSLTFQPIFTAFSATPTSAFAGVTTVNNAQPINNNVGQPHPRNPPAPRPQFPNFPIRALAVPFLMLLLRTVFLLYIFSPARKPLFALLITGWLVWELWAAAQGAIAEERRGAQNPPLPGQVPRNGNRNVGNGNAAPNAAPGLNGNRETPADRNRWAPRNAVDRLAGYHLEREDAMFDAPENSSTTRPPSAFNRLKQAFVLFILTIHPEVWNRRRRTLREREARVKRELTERRRQGPNVGEGEQPDNTNQANQRENPAPVERTQRRAPWLEEYIDRVERAEWIDG